VFAPVRVLTWVNDAHDPAASRQALFCMPLSGLFAGFRYYQCDRLSTLAEMTPNPADDAQSAPCPAPAPVPIAGAEFEQEDTWMTFGLGVDGVDEERTVTVVFRQLPEEESRGDDFVAEPLSPTFPPQSSSRRR
jgi:hypothetical protein